jgi:hypothetical protein
MPDMDPPGNADGTCKWIQVNDKDTCDSIAKDRCQIDPKQLYKFNGGSDSFCPKLVKGKALCCTKGKMPDLKPKKNADGSCVWAAVGDGEGCGTIAGSNFLEPEDLDALNGMYGHGAWCLVPVMTTCWLCKVTMLTLHSGQNVGMAGL